MINTEYLNWFHRKKKGMKNDERDENSPVEIIEGRLKRLRANEIASRIDAQTPGRKGVGRREKTQATGRGNR